MAANILIAAYPGAHDRAASVLSGHHLSFADTMAEAMAALEAQTFDLILIGARFDESRMFDLLRHLHTVGVSAQTPIVCFRGMISVPASEPATVEGLSLACGILGARAFYDFASYPSDEAGNAAVRRVLETHLSVKR
jgi:hypothetical protein